MVSTLLKVSILLALPLATGCVLEVKEPLDSGGESETAGDTDGQGTTSGGGTATATAGTSVGTSVSTSTSDPGDPTATDGSASDTLTGAGSSVGTSVGSATATTLGSDTDGDTIGDTEDPLGPPKPCEGEAVPIGPFATMLAHHPVNDEEPPDPSAGPSSGTVTGDPIDPETLTVRFSDHAKTCAAPAKPLECGSGDGWEVEIHIPPEFQSPGLYNLLGSDIIAVGTEVLDDGGDGCGFGGGSVGGSLEILAIDGDKVEGRLCHVDWAFGPGSAALEGSFVAPRCQ